MEQQLVVEMKDISISFNGVYALKNINHAIVGHNGAGNSTLMKVLMGAYQPDSGRVFLHGKEVDFRSPGEAQQSKISMVWQELSNFPNLSITENMMMSRFERNDAKQIDWQKNREKCKEYLARMELSDIDPDMKMSVLPLAQQQLVEFAKALSFNPDVLILDEPTSALSNTEEKVLYEKVRLIKAQGVAIIYISHKLEEVFALTDRVSVFRDGKKIFTKGRNSGRYCR